MDFDYEYLGERERAIQPTDVYGRECFAGAVGNEAVASWTSRMTVCARNVAPIPKDDTVLKHLFEASVPVGCRECNAQKFLRTVLLPMEGMEDVGLPLPWSNCYETTASQGCE